MEKYEKERRMGARRSFRGHRAEHHNRENIETLVWREPGSIMGMVVYRMVTPKTLVVTGDFGDFVFRWSSPVALKAIADMNTDYVLEKCVASPVVYDGNFRGPWGWDEGVAYRALFQQVYEQIHESMLEHEEDIQDHAKKVAEWFADYNGYPLAHATRWDWNEFMDSVEGCYQGVQFDLEDRSIGEVPGDRFFIIHEGLKMALEGKEETSLLVLKDCQPLEY